MSTTKSTNGYWSTILDQTKQLISMIGLKREQRKQRKLQNKIDEQCNLFNFNVDPSKGLDRYVVLKGKLYRVILLEQGLSITDENGQYVHDRLLRLSILVQFNKA